MKRNIFQRLLSAFQVVYFLNLLIYLVMVWMKYPERVMGRLLFPVVVIGAALCVLFWGWCTTTTSLSFQLKLPKIFRLCLITSIVLTPFLIIESFCFVREFNYGWLVDATDKGPIPRAATPVYYFSEYIFFCAGMSIYGLLVSFVISIHEAVRKNIKNRTSECALF